METILITGGSGFLGRHLAVKLKDRYRVVLAARNNGNNQLAQVKTGCIVTPMDITNANSVNDVLSEYKPDIIIHAAATKFVDISEQYPMECIDINVIGSQTLARIAMERKVKKFIAISTDKAAPPVGNLRSWVHILWRLQGRAWQPAWAARAAAVQPPPRAPVVLRALAAAQ